MSGPSAKGAHVNERCRNECVELIMHTLHSSGFFARENPSAGFRQPAPTGTNFVRNLARVFHTMKFIDLLSK